MKSKKARQEKSIITNNGKLRVDSFHKINELFPNLMTDYQNIQTNSLQNYLSKYSIEHAIKINDIKLAKKILSDLQTVSIIHESLNELEFYRIIDLTNSDLIKIASYFKRIKDIYNYKSIEHLFYNNISLENRIIFIDVQEKLENYYPTVYDYQIALNTLCQKALTFYQDEDEDEDEEYDDKDIEEYFDYFQIFSCGENGLNIRKCEVNSGSSFITTANNDVLNRKKGFIGLLSVGNHVSGKGISPDTFITDITQKEIEVNQPANNDASGTDDTTLYIDISKNSIQNCTIKNGSNKLGISNKDVFVWIYVEGNEVYGNGLPEGTFVEDDKSEEGFLVLNQNANTDATGKSDTTITFVATGKYAEEQNEEPLFSFKSIDDEEFIEYGYDSRLTDDDPDEDIDNNEEYKSNPSEIYLYLEEEYIKSLNEEDFDEEDFDEEDFDEEEYIKSLEDEEDFDVDEERVIIIKRMFLDETILQLYDDEEYFKNNETEAEINLCNLISLQNLQGSQDIADYAVDEDSLLVYRDNLKNFEYFLYAEDEPTNATVKTYGETITKRYEEFINKNQDNYKDLVKLYENTARLYSNYQGQVSNGEYNLKNDLTETRTYKMLYREYASDKDITELTSIDAMDLYDEFKPNFIDKFPVLVGRLEQLDKERTYCINKSQFWYKKAFDTNNIFGYDIDSFKFALLYKLKFSSDIMESNDLKNLFESLKQSVSIHDMINELLLIVEDQSDLLQLVDESDEESEKTVEAKYIISGYMSELLVDYFSQCKKYYGKSNKYIDTIFQLGEKLVKTYHESEERTVLINYYDLVVKDINSEKDAEFQFRLKREIYKMLSSWDSLYDKVFVSVLTQDSQLVEDMYRELKS